jgi:hypothetical protein
MKGLGVVTAAAVAVLAAVQSVRGNLIVAGDFEVGSGAPGAPVATQQTGTEAGAPASEAATHFAGHGYSGDHAAIASTVPPPNADVANRLNVGGNTLAAHSGTQYAYAYSNQGGLYGNIFQDVTGESVVPGQAYTASAYFLVKANNGSDGDRFQATAGAGAWENVRLAFFDGAGAQIGSTLQSPTFVDGTSPQNQWIPISVTGTAPAGTADVRVYAYLTRGTGSTPGGVMFVDDLSLEAVPEPGSLGLLLIGGGMGFARRRRR